MTGFGLRSARESNSDGLSLHKLCPDPDLHSIANSQIQFELSIGH